MSKNVYLRIVKLNNRKSCPTCKTKLGENGFILSSGEYINAKWHTIEYCCQHCFYQLDNKLKNQIDNFEYKGYQGFSIPNWIRK